MKDRRKVAWLIIGCLIIISIMAGSYRNIAYNNQQSSYLWGNLSVDNTLSEKVIEGEGTNKVAVIRINGVITDSSSDPSSYLYDSQGTTSESVIKQLNMAEKDENVEAVILQIDSPGGSVVAGDTLLSALEKFRSSGKRLVAVMRETAASAGYMVALPAEKIFANKATQTGSIGVIMQLADYQSLYDKIGVKPIVIKSGQMKDIGNPGRDMTSEERDVLQSMIDESYNDFVAAVSKWRKLEESRVRELADGRIYTGRQAKELNLIDDFGNQQDAINYIKGELGVDALTIIEYQAGPLGGIISSLFERISIGGELQNLIKKQGINNKLMYLWVL
jgi:protease-4